MSIRGAIIGSAAATGALLMPAAAPAARTSISVFSDPASWVGYGVQHLYTPRNADIHVERKYGRVDWIDVNPGRPPDNYTLELAGPRGRSPHRGVYDYTQQADSTYGDHPGLTVFGNARACNGTTGRFEIRDIARRRSGVIKRLWMIYEQHCVDATAGTYGEIRIREGHRLALPAVVRWPAGEHGSVGTASPVTFSPVTRAVGFRGARIVGHGRHAFRIVANRCSGRTIRAGESCRVRVVFRAGPGTHRAKLRVRAKGGRSYGAKLEGFDWGGRTGLVMHSEKGDFVGQGLDYRLTPRNAVVDRYGTRGRVVFNIYPPGDHWSAIFAAPMGGALTPGDYPNAVGYGMDAHRFAFDVGGAGRGCGRGGGSFSIKRLRFDPRDKSIREFAARFVQRCEGATAALRGRVEFRAGDHTKPAPWMRP